MPRPPAESADVVALWRLQAAYADIVTRRAWPELDTIFLPDVSMDIDTVSTPNRRVNGTKAFAEFVSGAVARFDFFEFMILNTVVDLDGETARGRVFMCEVRHEIDADAWSTAYGLYQDAYRRVDGRWWFAERHYRSLARTGANAGIFGVPPGPPPFGR